MENNNPPPTYIIEPTEDRSINRLIFGTANGETFEFGFCGSVDMLPRIQNFDFFLNDN